MQGVEYAKERIVMYQKEDAELWDLLLKLPRLSYTAALVCFFLNIFIPGTGTMLCSCLGYSGAWSKSQLTIGIV